MSDNTDIWVDGIAIPIGQTLRGKPARQVLPEMLTMRWLRYLDRIEPAGILSLSTGLHPPRIAENLPASAAGDERRRQLCILLPLGDAWVRGEIVQTAATIGDHLARRSAAGISSEDRLALYRAAGGALDWTRRICDLRALGCVISTVVFRGGGDRRAITRLHSRILIDDEPDDGLPVIPVETIVVRSYVDAAVAQATTAHARYRHHLTGLVDRGQRWRLGAELQARLAAAGLVGAEGRP